MTITFNSTIESILDDDTASTALRDLMIDESADLSDLYTDRIRLTERDRILDAITALSTDDQSLLALALSLCPMHTCDYAICFDDDDPECAAIRACFPSHDT